MKEQDIIRVLSEGYSEGTEAFRDALLDRCLDALGSESVGFRLVGTDGEDTVHELGIEELDLLAAAGSLPDRLAEELTRENNDSLPIG